MLVETIVVMMFPASMILNDCDGDDQNGTGGGVCGVNGFNGDCETTGNGGRESDTKDNIHCGA